MTDRMTGAEYAAWRHLLGLTGDELAAMLGVRPRTARAWETDRDPIPYGVPAQLAQIKAEHDALAQRYASTDEVIGIVRDKTVATACPRGWYVAAAARALHPDMDIEWL